jgi:ATP-dependent Lon protease
MHKRRRDSNDDNTGEEEEDDTDVDEYEEEEDEDEDDEEDEDEDEVDVDVVEDKTDIRDSYSLDELNYFLNLSKDEQKEILAIEESHRHMKNLVPTRFKILKSAFSPSVKEWLLSKHALVEKGSEHGKFKTYIDAMCALPIGVYKQLPKMDNMCDFLKDARSNLDKAVFGHEEAKDHIIRLLAQWLSNPDSKGLVIGIEGAMGCGKTTLIKNGICKSLGLPFGFIPLGGVSDGSYLTGHSYTYEGSKFGKIAEILLHSKFSNTILFFDELDKVSTTRQGDEIINTLMQITDSTQSEHFRDKYFSEVDIDISRSLIVFSFNDASAISPILRDRMITIKTAGYSLLDKQNIARSHLIPEALHKFARFETDIVISDDIIKTMINNSTEEKGVRNLKRTIEKVLSIINYKAIVHTDIVFPFVVSNEFIRQIIKHTENNTIHNTMYV